MFMPSLFSRDPSEVLGIERLGNNRSHGHSRSPDSADEIRKRHRPVCLYRDKCSDRLCPIEEIDRYERDIVGELRGMLLITESWREFW